MKYLLKSNMRTMFVACIFAISPAIADSSNADAVNVLNSHWNKVVNESDAQKRQQLLQSHEQMMKEYASQTSHDSHHVNIMNTIDFHKSMMGLMQ